MTSPPLDTGERAMPAIHAADERTTLTAMLDWYREGVALKVEGMDQQAATTSALRSGTTPAGLAKHLALVEDFWFTDRLAGRGDPEPWVSAPFEHDPDWEFHSAAHEPLASSVDLYNAACARSWAVTAELDLDDAAVDVGQQRVVPVPALERRGGELLVAVGGHQGGVEVDDQRPGGGRVVVRSIRAGQ